MTAQGLPISFGILQELVLAPKLNCVCIVHSLTNNKELGCYFFLLFFNIISVKFFSKYELTCIGV